MQFYLFLSGIQSGNSAIQEGQLQHIGPRNSRKRAQPNVQTKGGGRTMTGNGQKKRIEGKGEEGGGGSSQITTQNELEVHILLILLSPIQHFSSPNHIPFNLLCHKFYIQFNEFNMNNRLKTVERENRIGEWRLYLK